MRIFCAGCAAATPPSETTTTRIASALEAIDPLLRVDPLLEVRRRGVLGSRLQPGFVRVLRAAEHVVDDAEIDERLGRIAAERLELAQLRLVQRQRDPIERQPALLLGGGRFFGGREILL